MEPAPMAIKAIDTLIPIWQRVLQRSSIGIEDNFFDLGGNPQLAASLLAEIERVCGRELPQFTIYRAPTLSALSNVLASSTIPSSLPIIPLKSGDEWPPVFMAPGAGADPLGYFQLARHIDSRRPIFVFQARGLESKEQPLDHIEEMAQYYLETVKTLQPHGPYLLIGYSLGGLVALEMAQHLVAGGEKVALLAMLESYPHPNFIPLIERIRLTTRLAKHHLSMSRRLPVREACSYLLRRATGRLYLIGSEGRRQPPEGVSLSREMVRLRNADYMALKRYRPRFYRGAIRFIKAAVSLHFPDNPTAVWAGLAKEFAVDTVPGDHKGIVITHFESLAAVLTLYLKEALG